MKITFMIVRSFSEGEVCYDGAGPGVCCRLPACTSAVNDLRLGISPPRCSYEGFVPIVCCRSGCPTSRQTGVWTTTTRRPGVARIRPNLAGPVSGATQWEKRISERMCDEYEIKRSKRSSDRYHYDWGHGARHEDYNYNPNLTPPPSAPTTPKWQPPTTSSSYTYRFIIRGVPALPDEFPHMAAIGWQLLTGGYSFKCGGSLISPKFVLTAGHCLSLGRDSSVLNPEPRIVRLGDLNILRSVNDTTKPEDVFIIRILYHPQYLSPTQYFDIGLLELEYEVKITNHIRPACLWTKTSFSPYSEAVVTGWGATVPGAKKNSPVLQKVKLDLLDTRVCDPLLKKYRHRNWRGFADHQMCAGVLAGGRDACQGDSGGPLQIKQDHKLGKHRFRIIGITSFGRECAVKNQPGVYTRVSSFIDWIESIVWA